MSIPVLTPRGEVITTITPRVGLMTDLGIIKEFSKSGQSAWIYKRYGRYWQSCCILLVSNNNPEIETVFVREKHKQDNYGTEMMQSNNKLNTFARDDLPKEPFLFIREPSGATSGFVIPKKGMITDAGKIIKIENNHVVLKRTYCKRHFYITVECATNDGYLGGTFIKLKDMK